MTLDVLFDQFENKLKKFLASRPTHLVEEHDIRQAMAEALLESDREKYQSVSQLQYEKSGDGVPPRSPVDLFFRLDEKPHFVEFKFWHTMVKCRTGKLEIGKGNATGLDYRKLKKDFVKQSRIRCAEAERIIVYLVQVEQYPERVSPLVPEVARSQEPENAVALFESTREETTVLLCDRDTIKFELAREPKSFRSLDPLEFKLYVYRIL